MPCRPDLEDTFLITWKLPGTFKDVVAKLNELGANYKADVPDDFYGWDRDIMKLQGDDRIIKNMAEVYNVGCGGDEFYERLDIKSVFYYRWTEGDVIHDCIVTAEGGELKAYSCTT